MSQLSLVETEPNIRLEKLVLKPQKSNKFPLFLHLIELQCWNCWCSLLKGILIILIILLRYMYLLIRAHVKILLKCVHKVKNLKNLSDRKIVFGIIRLEHKYFCKP